NKDEDSNLGNLQFVSVQLPKTTTTTAGITASVSVSGPNLCYSFKEFQVTTSEQKVYNIYAKGNVPGPNDICAQAIYRKDTTLHVATPAPGKYVLNFQNPNGLFRSDTVQVN
ncbi:MAG TPA: hypothetical protein VM368_04715, partial [Flavisolibacter sp.]|nr:hypothetical protein [Flavisolibacter sp.]